MIKVVIELEYDENVNEETLADLVSDDLMDAMRSDILAVCKVEISGECCDHTYESYCRCCIGECDTCDKKCPECAGEESACQDCYESNSIYPESWGELQVEWEIDNA